MDKTDNTPDQSPPVWPNRMDEVHAPPADLPRRTPGGAFAPGQAEVTWDRPFTPDYREAWALDTAERHGRVRPPMPARRPQPPYNSLERPVHPEEYPPPPAAQGAAVKGHNPGLTFLGMSGGILALAVTGVILLFCVAPLVLCFGMGVVGMVTPTPSPSF